MVEWAIVEWGTDLVPFHKLDSLEEGDFYVVYAAIPLGRKQWKLTRASLLYLGMAYSQPLVQRIRQDHTSWELVSGYHSAHRDRDLVVRAGWLPKDAHSTRRVTREFIEDVESLLIFVNQPKLNARSKQSYTGRPLVLVSAGDFKPLRAAIASTERALSTWEHDGGWSEVEPWLGDGADGEQVLLDE